MSDAPAERTVGFAVIYRWRVGPGREEPFREGWERVTAALARLRGGLGSRLHRAEDGSWVAYAQWPSREAWEAARSAPQVDPEAARLMAEATEESFAPLLLTPVADRLTGAGA